MYSSTTFIYTQQGQVVTNILEICFQEGQKVNINLSLICNTSQCMCLQKNPSAVCASQWFNSSEQPWPMWIAFYSILKYVWTSKCIEVGAFRSPQTPHSHYPQAHSAPQEMSWWYCVTIFISFNILSKRKSKCGQMCQHCWYSHQFRTSSTHGSSFWTFWRRKKEGERGGEQHNKGKTSFFKTVSPIRNTAVIFFKLETEKLILISHKPFHW